MRPITEYDDYKIPPPFTGEFTPEVLAAKEAAERRAAELQEKLDRELGLDRKRAVPDESQTYKGDKHKKRSKWRKRR